MVKRKSGRALNEESVRVAIMLFAENLVLVRRSRGESIDDVSARSGIPRTYLTRLEGGHVNPTLKTITVLADALNVPVYRLLMKNS